LNLGMGQSPEGSHESSMRFGTAVVLVGFHNSKLWGLKSPAMQVSDPANPSILRLVPTPAKARESSAPVLMTR
jgi:hypothetical protein